MKKVNKKTTAAAMCGAAVVSMIYVSTSSKEINAEQYVDTTSDAILLNVDKQDKDTIKLSLSNFSDLAKSLQLSVKIDGNATFNEDNIKWAETLKDAKTNVKLSNDKKTLDIVITSSTPIYNDGGHIEICEIDVAKEDQSQTSQYKVVPNVDAEGVSYNYVIDTTNRQVKGSDITNTSSDTLTINNAPVLSLKDMPSIVEGKIILQKDTIFTPLEYVVANDDEDGELESNKITSNSNVNTKSVGSYTVNYTVVDSEGEKAQLEVPVIVEEAAEVSDPVINMTSDVIQTRVGEKIDLLEGVTATDYLDRNLDIKVSGDYNFDEIGEYTITYTATDAVNKTVTAERKLVVNRQDAPIISGVRAEVVITVGESFDPKEGVKATDYEGKDLEVTLTGDYNVNVPGEYIIKYNAEDSYGTKAIELQTKLIVKEKPQVPETPETPQQPDNNIPDNDNTSGDNSSENKPETDTEVKVEIPNEIKDLITTNNNVVTAVSGNGTKEKPLKLEVKKVTSDDLTGFLNKFEGYDFNLTNVNTVEGKTTFNIRLSKKTALLSLRANEDIYLAIEVDSNETELINTIKNFAGITDGTTDNNNSGSSSNSGSNNNSSGSIDINNSNNNNSNNSNNAQTAQNNTSTSNSNNSNVSTSSNKNNSSKLPSTGEVVGSSIIAVIGAVLAGLGIKLTKKK